MKDNYYDTAQICLNGHTVNSNAISSPQLNQKHCAECGKQTITKCPACNTAIRGYYTPAGSFELYGYYYKPAYCHNCGEAFPWTTSSLKAASELVDELEALNPEEKQQLKDSFPDIVKDTPKTVVAGTRFKRLMEKAGAEAYDGMKSILINVVSEAVKKSVFGPIEIYMPNKALQPTPCHG